MSVVIYSFKAFPAVNELQKMCSNVFLFAKLKEDLAGFEELITKEKPNFILGVAATKRPTRIEPVAINKFNNGKVVHGGSDTLQLYMPANLPAGFKVATKPTHSFCNWTMYHIQTMLDQKHPDTKFMFVHVNVKDMSKLRELLESIT